MATREILLNLAEDQFGGPLPADGRFVAFASAARVSGPEVTLPLGLTRDIVASAFSPANPPVALEVNGDPFGWYWTILVRDEDDTVRLRRHVIIPIGVDPIAIGSLPVVDPGTETVDGEPQAAWWIALEQRPIIVRLTQAEYNNLTPEQQNDPHILYLIPAIV